MKEVITKRVILKNIDGSYLIPYVDVIDDNLPDGFTFTNSEITGAAKNPGEYRFNIISENTSVPVIMNVSNIIRIS